VWISACVERVSNVFPHAQWTMASAYSGWMSVFIESLEVILRTALKYSGGSA
jgi:hypothetical protein